MKLSGVIHRVNIVYKPEKEEMESQEVSLSFSTEEAARDFVKRQQKLDQVHSAKYLGVKG